MLEKLIRINFQLSGAAFQKSQSKVLDKLLKGQARAKASIPSKNT